MIGGHGDRERLFRGPCRGGEIAKARQADAQVYAPAHRGEGGHLEALPGQVAAEGFHVRLENLDHLAVLPQVQVVQAQTDTGEDLEAEIAHRPGGGQRPLGVLHGGLELAHPPAAHRHVRPHTRQAMLIAEHLGEALRLAKRVEHPRQLPEQQVAAVEVSAKVDGQADRVGAFGEVLERTEGLLEAGHGRAGGAARAGTGPGAPEEVDGPVPHLAFPEMRPPGPAGAAPDCRHGALPAPRRPGGGAACAEGGATGRRRRPGPDRD